MPAPTQQPTARGDPAAAPTLRFWRTPLDHDQAVVPRGEVIILSDRCKGCAFCVEYCPRDVLAMSPGFNRKGYHPPETVRAADCVDCGLCEMICPEFAIFSVSRAAVREAGT